MLTSILTVTKKMKNWILKMRVKNRLQFYQKEMRKMKFKSKVEREIDIKNEKKEEKEIEKEQEII